MKKRHLAGLVALVILLGGWKPTIVRSATAKEDAQAKEFVADPERALVYVYREGKLIGKNAESQLVIDNVSVTSNESGKFVVVSMKPGAYKLMSVAAKEANAAAMLVHNSRKTPVELTAEAGKIYYFQEVFKPLGGFSLKSIPDDEAKAAIAKLKLLARYER